MKIEPNFIKRCTVYRPVQHELSEGTKFALGVTEGFSVKILTDAELFARKITAALDRLEMDWKLLLQGKNYFRNGTKLVTGLFGLLKLEIEETAIYIEEHFQN
ncbi:hypothetical protein MNBD_GAMMA12-2961 [hydrothermal vent metagenome]|uniref:Uncharacterized protein n=1 Tax=hydrothermal vent metagenome TaxID=652676 RepID=A0A3B0Y9D5_9ZZZZ